jgi:pyruvate formate lyase activating enzyme
MIAGINSCSYNDYPGEMSYVIFLGGCNFRCPYCHNATIVNCQTLTIDENEVIENLLQRKNFLKAVVITGGEPTLYGEELIRLIKRIKDLGYKVKLDSNGTNPDLLSKIISLKLVDYFAIDIKNIYTKYDLTTGVKVNIEDIKKAIKLIEDSGIDYEFRTTINQTQHTLEDIKEIKTYFKNQNKFILQNYKYSKEQLVNQDYVAYNDQQLDEIKSELKINIKQA